MKLLLILLGIAVAGLALIVGLGYLWWEKSGEQFLEEMDKVVKEARAFGETTNEEGCLKEVIVRSDDCSVLDISCRLDLTFFLNTCLEVAEKAEGFCTDVPKPGEFLSMTDWATDKCEEYGSSSDVCSNVVIETVNYCAQ